MDQLTQLGLQYGTDKATTHQFTNFYHNFLQDIREDAKWIMEIGVLNNSSLRMWEDYFTNATIVGVDNQDKFQYEEDRITIHTGDQTDVKFLNDVFNQYGHFEIILDDGGHSWKQQIISFETLFPLLTPGGLYFVEDMHTSYRPQSVWDDYHITGMNYFKNLTDSVNLNGKSFCGYKEINNQPLDYYERNIDYIHFYKSVLAISKKMNSL